MEGTSLADQWLGICDSTVGGTGLIPRHGTRILCSKKKKKSRMEKNKCLRKLMDAVVVIRGELTTSASDYQGKERKMTKKTHFKVLFQRVI